MINSSPLSPVTLCYSFWSTLFPPSEGESQNLKQSSSLSIQGKERDRGGERDEDNAHFLWLTLFCTANRQKLVYHFQRNFQYILFVVKRQCVCHILLHRVKSEKLNTNFCSLCMTQPSKYLGTQWLVIGTVY